MKTTIKSFAAVLMVFGLSGCLAESKKEPVSLETPATNAPVPAQTVIPEPQYAVGQAWTYSDGYGYKVSEVTSNNRARFDRTDVDDQWFVRRAFFKEESQSRTAHRLVVYRTADPIDLLSSPLNKPIIYVREYMRNDDLMRHRTSWVIEGKEKITVPAGSFDVWVIVMRTESLDSNWKGYERWYYSPSVNGYVRLEYKYGEAPEGSRVLMSYTPGAGS